MNQKTFTITIHPSPVVTNTPAQLQTTICSGISLNFTPTSNTGVTTTYSWTSTFTGSLTGVTASGTGAITDSPVNTGSSAGVITYKITPTFNTCAGMPVNYLVTVEPVPNAAASNQTICSGQTTSVAITNPNAVAGTTYTWTVASSTNATGMTAGSGATISQQLFSTDGVNPGTVNYSVTPTANGCTGASIPVTVTINPSPVITNTATQLQTTICSGTALSFTPTSSIGGTTYTWTSSVLGSITGNTISGSGVITDSPSNSGITQGTVTYHITPSIGVCSGVAKDYVVTVQPIPSLSVTNSTAQICSGSQTNILLNTPVIGGQIRLKAVTYGSVSGTLSVGALFNNGQSVSEVLTNSTNGPLSVVYQFEAIVGACGPSASKSATVIVNPNPTMQITNATPVICSGTQPSITLTSPTTGASMSLQNVTYGSVTGGLYAAGGTFLTGAVINESAGGLVNTTNNPITITYTFTVTTPLTSPSCPLSVSTQSTTVQVLPAPAFNYTNSAPTICSGGQANITLNTSVTGGQIRLKSVTYGAVNGTLTAGLIYSNGQMITEVLINPTNAPVTVTYQFEPIIGGCAAGVPMSTNVQVNPSPVFSINNNTPAVCEGSPVNIQLNSPTSGAVISLSAVNYNGVTGTLSPGATFTAGQTITETLATPFTTPTQVTYTFTVAASGCSNPTSQQTFVSITKQATVSLPANYTVCQPNNIALTGTIGGSAVTGLWSVVSGTGSLSASNVSGSTVTANYSPSISDVTQTVIFKLTTNDPDGAGPCSSASATISIHINQAAQVFAPANLAICQNVPSIALGGSIGGSTTTTIWSGGTGTFSNVNNPNATYTYKNPNEINTTVVLTITALDPDGAGPCTSVSTTTNLKINPLPFVFFTGLPATMAQNDAPVTLTGNNSGGAFTILPVTSSLTNPQSSPVDRVTFDPSIMTLGVNTVDYTYTNANGCKKDTARSIIINPVTSVNYIVNGKVTLSTGEIPLCSNEGTLALVPNVDITTGLPPTGFYAAHGPDSVILASHIIKVGSNYFISTDSLPSNAYPLTFVFKNSFGATSTYTHTLLVYPSPKPKFTPLNNCVVTAIKFKTNSSISPSSLTPSNPATFVFNYGDGSNQIYYYPAFGDTSTATHAYAMPKKYAVSLTMTTDKGCSTTSPIDSLKIGNPPTPTFTWSAICTNDSTKFVDHSFPGIVSTITNLEWNFGDLTPAVSGVPSAKVTNQAANHTGGTYSNPNHKYTANGTYTVTLKVNNNNGCYATSPFKKVFILDYKTKKVLVDSAYFENFENATSKGGGWIPEVPNGYFATNSTPTNLILSDTSWVWSKPNGLVIKPAPQTGNYSWWTGKNSNSYFYYENSAVNGPCFNLTKLNRPMVSLDYWVNTEVNSDGAVLQYSTDGGVSWQIVGPLAGLPAAQRNQGINWYSPGAIVTSNPGEQPSFGPYGWTGSTQAAWYHGSYNLDMIPLVNPLNNLDTLRKQVRLRIAFASKGAPSGNAKYDGFGFDNFFVGNKIKNVLFENFTNANQTGSVNAEANFNTLYQTQRTARRGESDFNYLQYHVRFPSPDIFSQANADDASARALFYNVQQPPYTVMDGIQVGAFASGDYSQFLNGVEIDRRALRKPQILITKVDTIATGSKNKINARIHIKADTVITFPIYGNIALVEDSVLVSGSYYTHVVRKLLYSASGSTPSLQTLTPGGLDSLVLTNPVNNGVTTLDCQINDPTKLRLVAWVQNIDPLKRGRQEIIQSYVLRVKPNSKAGQVITGVESTTGILDDIVLYPNPAESKFYLSLPGDYPTGSVWKIADQRGIYVLSGNFNDAFGGKKTIDISSLINGVYIVAIGAPGQNPAYRKLIVLN
ncbi:MAG: PKD domain-containing protein [Bacteroidetes bacterium]|nr:PKD domain-containing protein [Bacteroidota bacterium]